MGGAGHHRCPRSLRGRARWLGLVGRLLSGADVMSGRPSRQRLRPGFGGAGAWESAGAGGTGPGAADAACALCFRAARTRCSARPALVAALRTGRRRRRAELGRLGGLHERASPSRRGRPRTRPAAVPADKAYPSRAIREHLRRRGIRAVIPVPPDQRGHRLRRGSRAGRPPAYDRETCKQRNPLERCINRLKQWLGIATRYEKTAAVHLAGLHVASIFLWSAR